MINHTDFSCNKRTWHGLSITNKAASQIRKLMKKNPNSQGLLINIKKSGCAGFIYAITLINHTTKEYLLFENNGAKVFVSLKVIPFIDGTEIDYVSEGLNHAFKFNNPKAQHACGCGESFAI
ncbi:Fe-S cluster assembly scaffold SufA [Arsenophonus symbiont of Ornithomya chloropus]|uniref:Fe-S cluster assembly scaffold SufA n=1 Tax=Arsenophonus symbiont of Ornithomya chloropus TaxID=634121 RepID=UPI0032B2993D